MKTRVLNLFTGLFLVLGCGNIMAQVPEIFPLWPQSPKESNGLRGGKGSFAGKDVADNSVAELFVYRPQADATDKALVICPGGGYHNLAMNHEGEQFAHWLNKQGITAIVLKYRMPNGHDKIPLADAQRAIRWVKGHAEEWGVNSVGIAGFSAGGHLASMAAIHFDMGKSASSDRLERLSCRPDFVVLFYPVISMKPGLTHIGSRNALLGKSPVPEMIDRYSNELHVTSRVPPVFIVHCDDDSVVPVANSSLFYQALKKNKVPAALYIFDKGGHGWGMRTTYEYYPQWTSLLEKWLNHL